MDDENDATVRLRGREVLSNNWYVLEKVSFEQVGRDGQRQTQAREVYHNGPGAAVLPIDRARGTVLLVRQLRIAALVNGDAPMLIEACAGMVEPGDEPAETVRKEAEQELGYRLRDLRALATLYMSPGASAEKLHLFAAAYAPGDRIGEGGGEIAEGERIDVLELPLARAWQDGDQRRDHRREDRAAAATCPAGGRRVHRWRAGHGLSTAPPRPVTGPSSGGDGPASTAFTRQRRARPMPTAITLPHKLDRATMTCQAGDRNAEGGPLQIRLRPG